MPSVRALITEAMRKAAVAWLTVGEGPAYPVWCLWVDEALYVVSGPDEQPAPGLADATSATVSARGDHGGLIVSWPAAATRVAPEDPLWTAVVPQLAGKRLNSASAAELVDRWAAACVVTRLTPADPA
jgi:hypothetical protein